MSYDSRLHPCAHPGCHHWALYHSNACAVHIGLVDHPAAGRLAGRSLSPLGERSDPERSGEVEAPQGRGVRGACHATASASSGAEAPGFPLAGGMHGGDLLSFRRACLDRYLHLTLGYRPFTLAEQTRHLHALARTTPRSPRAAAGPTLAERERFLGDIADRVRADPRWQTDRPPADLVRPPTVPRA